MPKTAKPKKTWVFAPSEPTPPAVPAALKQEVEEQAHALVESVLKPKHVQPPPENPQSNYIEDITTKWYGNSISFSARYRSAGPHALGGTFENKFARLTHLGGGRFTLATTRHTGAWMEIHPNLTLEEGLAAVRDDPWFQP